jgi:hypothetical protein
MLKYFFFVLIVIFINNDNLKRPCPLGFSTSLSMKFTIAFYGPKEEVILQYFVNDARVHSCHWSHCPLLFSLPPLPDDRPQSYEDDVTEENSVRFKE